MTALSTPPDTMPPMQEHATTELRCMQVWGGSQSADQALKMTGLNGYLYARPHDGAERGGDVYYISSCASGRITRVLVADVAGHGSQVAEIAGGLRTLMQRYVNYTNQPKFMNALNRKFARVSEAGRFATMVAMSYFAPTRRLSLSNAGHPPPVLYRAREKRWTALVADKQRSSARPADLPLGIVDNAGYDQVDLDFEPGDLLLLYTDALIESRGLDRRLLGVGGLVEVLNQLDRKHPDRLVPALIDRLTRDDEHGLSGDDVTVLLVESTGQKCQLKKVLLSPIYAVCGLVRGIPLSAS